MLYNCYIYINYIYYFFIIRRNINNYCDRLIDEQEKYINYYKVKKTYGGDKNKDFDEITMKKVGDFHNFDKMYLGLYIQNLKTELSSVNNVMDEDKLLYN